MQWCTFNAFCSLQVISVMLFKGKESLGAEVSAISEEVQPQAIATPARGRGRGKGRGKKAQPTPSTDQELGTSSRSSSPYSVSAESEQRL